MEYGMHEAKTHLSQLVEQALHGDEVVITRRGKPAVRLERVAPKTGALALMGAWKGQVEIAEDFDELPDGIATAFDAG
jgi:antitoxin (DNA-binding transcriptional repressor) of toxin-antitoxin stability system